MHFYGDDDTLVVSYTRNAFFFLLAWPASGASLYLLTFESDWKGRKKDRNRATLRSGQSCAWVAPACITMYMYHIMDTNIMEQQ